MSNDLSPNDLSSKRHPASICFVPFVRLHRDWPGPLTDKSLLLVFGLGEASGPGPTFNWRGGCNAIWKCTR